MIFDVLDLWYYASSFGKLIGYFAFINFVHKVPLVL